MIRTQPILDPGRNCWTADAPLHACGLLIDGREYYRAFYRAARQARHYIFIAGWKFNSDVRLLRGDDAVAGQETKLLPFLRGLIAEQPDLRIHLLAWDYSAIYAWEWEWNLDMKFSDSEGRLQFRFDSQHALGASHHQKFVVIDGCVAFAGGFDFNGDDWDDRDHRPDHPDRGDSGRHHGPYHDVQACLVGPAAEELARYFQKRWHDSGHGDIEIPAPRPLKEIAIGLPIHADRAALSVNESASAEPVVQIRQLYLDAILAARKLIYVENQYLTADAVVGALERRMRDRRLPRLEIVIVQPKQLPGWIEAATLEPLRLRVVDTLAHLSRQTGHRVGQYYSAGTDGDGAEVPTLIHSKVLIVDDRFLTVGSANISNRSQGLDTELNVSWETLDGHSALAASIRAIRGDLLAEHSGLRTDAGARKSLVRCRGLVDYLDRLASGGTTRLRQLTRASILEERQWLAGLERLGFSLDPAHPLIEEWF